MWHFGPYLLCALPAAIARSLATFGRMPTTPSLLDSVRALTAPVGELGGWWMLADEVLAPGKAFGYPNGYAYYVTGRGGVLGDVDADVVASAFGFFHPALIRKMWQRGLEVEPARAAATRYGDACAEYGRRRMATFGQSERLAELAGKVAAGVDVSGLALFAGWRAHPLPDDARGRAYQLLHVLRELRGSVHVLAVAASGLTPLQAVLATGGEENANRFGWPRPYTDVAPAVKESAELLTDQVLARLYSEVIDEAEAGELANLAHDLRRCFTTL